MTRTEAAEFFDHQLDSDLAAVQRPLAELYSDLHSRLTDAASAALEGLYRGRVATVGQARALLFGAAGGPPAEASSGGGSTGPTAAPPGPGRPGIGWPAVVAGVVVVAIALFWAQSQRGGGFGALSGPRPLGEGFGAEQFASIPAGSIEMDSTQGLESESAGRPVPIAAFQLQKTEVTQAQWEAVMGNNPSAFKGCPRCPVEQVTWGGGQSFLERLNGMGQGRFRLPFEAEWAYAARAGGTSDSGGTGSLDETGWYLSNSDGKPHEVAQKLANGWGLHDMYGNVWEWVGDTAVEGKIKGSPGQESSDPDDVEFRVLRGGSWNNNAIFTRTARRVSPTTVRNTIRFAFNGLRLVKAE